MHLKLLIVFLLDMLLTIVHINFLHTNKWFMMYMRIQSLNQFLKSCFRWVKNQYHLNCTMLLELCMWAHISKFSPNCYTLQINIDMCNVNNCIIVQWHYIYIHIYVYIWWKMGLKFKLLFSPKHVTRIVHARAYVKVFTKLLYIAN